LLAEKYRAEIERVIAKYPPEHKRSAVMPLLYLAQKEYGHIGEAAMAEVGELCGLSPTQVAGIVGFYSLYYAHPGGRRRVQVCTDLPCALREADAFLQALCENLGIQIGETTADGLITIEAVTCLAACDKAPMFQLQTSDDIEYHENMTVDRTLELIRTLRRARREAA
jgi:NADH-quinone oxidoreductase subunit E